MPKNWVPSWCVMINHPVTPKEPKDSHARCLQIPVSISLSNESVIWFTMQDIYIYIHNICLYIYIYYTQLCMCICIYIYIYIYMLLWTYTYLFSTVLSSRLHLDSGAPLEAISLGAAFAGQLRSGVAEARDWNLQRSPASPASPGHLSPALEKHVVTSRFHGDFMGIFCWKKRSSTWWRPFPLSGSI